MFELVSLSFSCILWGALAALLIVGLLLFLFMTMSRKQLSPVGYVTAALLFILLTIQGTLITGGFKLKGMVEDIQQNAELMVQTTTTSVQDMVPSEQSEKILRKLEKDYHIPTTFLSDIHFDGENLQAMPSLIGSNIQESISDYIIRRFFWSFGFLVVAIIVMAVTRETTGLSYSARSRNAGSSRNQIRPTRQTRRIRR